MAINLFILLNTLTFALDTHPIEPAMAKTIEIANYVFYGIFLTEMFIKLLGTGFASYFRDRFNVFDFIIVLLSTVDVCLFIYFD